MKPTKDDYRLMEADSILSAKYWIDKSEAWVNLAESTPCLFQRNVFCFIANKCLDHQDAYMRLATIYRKLGTEC
jgi:hypothetical protein